MSSTACISLYSIVPLLLQDYHPNQRTKDLFLDELHCQAVKDAESTQITFRPGHL